MRKLVYLLAFTVAACGGGSPNTPTPQTTSTTTTSVVPFPSMIGNWVGATVIIAVVTGQSASNTCPTTWSITSQTGGQFSGTFQLSGGSFVPCAQSGGFTGTIGTDNRITDFTLAVLVGSTGCTRTGGTGVYTGLLSGGSASITTNDTVQCGNTTGTRNVTMTMAR